MKFLEYYAVAAVLFVAIDSLWIGLVANKFYKKQLGGLLADKPKFAPAVIFYLIYMAAVIFFAVDPALKANSLWMAGERGAFLGLVMYATYDLTNHSTLKDWPLKLTLVDMAWGTVITKLVTVLTFVIFR